MRNPSRLFLNVWSDKCGIEKILRGVGRDNTPEENLFVTSLAESGVWQFPLEIIFFYEYLKNKKCFLNDSKTKGRRKMTDIRRRFDFSSMSVLLATNRIISLRSKNNFAFSAILLFHMRIASKRAGRTGKNNHHKNDCC